MQAKGPLSRIAALSRFAGFEPLKLQRSRTYDLLMRLPLLAWAILATAASSADFLRYLHGAGPPLPASAFVINVGMRLSTLGFLLLIAASVILRARPKGRARGIEPRISALLGSFLAYGVCFFPRRELSPAAEITATLLVLFGSAGAIIVLGQLGRSFSIMAEARQLVTSGVYGFVRHPLYLAEEAAIVGVAVQFLSYWTAPILIAQIAFLLRRMYNEEAVLAETFPEYSDYKARTAKLLPGIY